MYCAHCRAQLPDNALICPDCNSYAKGENWTCPACDASNPSQALFCPSCGFSLTAAEQNRNGNTPPQGSENATTDQQAASKCSDPGTQEHMGDASADAQPSASSNETPGTEQNASSAEEAAAANAKPSDASAQKKRPLIPIVAAVVAVVALAVVLGTMAYLRIGPFTPPETVVLQLDDVSDEALRTYLETYVDTNNTGAVSDEEAQAVTEIGTLDAGESEGNGLFGLGITDLSCLSVFPNLQTLVCSNNSLATLDTSANSQLQNLLCSGNQLSSLDVSNNASLQQLVCSNNALSELSVAGNANLQNIACAGNAIPSLDLSANTQLVSIDCNDNQMAELVVPATTTLTTVHATGNELSSIDVSQAPNITDLQLDSGIAITGAAFEDQAAAAMLQDMFLPYFMAVVGESTTVDQAFPVEAGENPNVDIRLFKSIFASEFVKEYVSSPLPSERFETSGWDSDHYYLNIPEASVRAVLASYFGSCPEDLSYLPADNTPELGANYNGDGTVTVGVSSVAIGFSTSAANWSSYGPYVAGDISVTGTYGVYSDQFRHNFHVVFKEDPNSVFGYHLDSVTFLGTDTIFNHETFDYYGYMIDQITAKGLAEGIDGYEDREENSSEVTVRGVYDRPDHVGTVAWFKIDKLTRQIYIMEPGDENYSPI